MIKKLALSTAVAVSALAALPAAADAQSRYGYYDAGRYGYQNSYRGYDRRYDGRYGQRYNQRYYGQRYNTQRYGNYYGYRCSRSGSSTGTILGAIAGGLLGREVAGRGDRTVGAIIGAGALMVGSNTSAASRTRARSLGRRQIRSGKPPSFMNGG